MINIIKLGILLVAIIIGSCIAIWKVYSPVKIEYHVWGSEWFVPNAFVSFLMLMAIVFETELYCISLAWKQDGTVEWALYQLFSGGIVVPVFNIVFSVIYIKYIRMFQLDLAAEYSEELVKIFFTFQCIFACVILGSAIWKEVISGNRDIVQPIANRIVLWVYAGFSIWIGFDFWCRRGIKAKKENVFWTLDNLRENIRYHAFFLISTVLPGLLIILSLLNNIFVNAFLEYVRGVCLVTLSLMLGIMLLSGKIFKINGKISDVLLKRSLKKVLSGKVSAVCEQYDRENYILFNRGGEIYLWIKERTVIWENIDENKKNEKNKLFGERKPVRIISSDEKKMYEEIHDILQMIAEERNEYVQKGFRHAESEWKNAQVRKKIEAISTMRD